MNTPNCINGSQLKDMFIAGSKWLKAHVNYVNALNVFPVPDGDTGTNMFLTLDSAIKTINTYSGLHAAEVATMVSRGALMGARGNSGVILSQILQGFSDGLQGKEIFSTTDFAGALQAASGKAYKAVVTPVEGTILTVIRSVADMAQQISPTTPKPADFLATIVETGWQTLNLTPQMLPLLKEAGVVDSGGQGLVYFLEGMDRYVKGFSVEMDTGEEELQLGELHITPPEEAFDPAYPYDVQFLINGDNLNIDSIRKTIIKMGDCPLVVGDSHTVKVHIHVPDPGVPISYGISQGYITDVVVENMEQQYHEFFQHQAIAVAPVTPIGTICITPGLGLAQVFESLGATVVINGGQTMNPSTQQILDAIHTINAPQIVILPNNSNIILTAQQASSMTDKVTEVIPTKTIPQGISALLTFNAEADLQTNAHRMTAAIQTVQTIETTIAVRTTTVNGITVNHGDVIGLLNNTLVATGTDHAQVILAVLQTIAPQNYEVATLYYGQDVTEPTARMVIETLVTAYPQLEFEAIDGGQPHYHYIISLE